MSASGIIGAVPESDAEPDVAIDLPSWIPPMKASSGLPPGTGPGGGWAAELKWDGLRMQAAFGRGAIRLRSSTGRDVTTAFPEMASLGQESDSIAVVDGELVVFDGDRPVFQRVLQRLNVDRPPELLVHAHPVVYIVFDLLQLDGRSLLGLPLRTRRRLLADYLADGPQWRVPPYVEDGADALMALARERDLEGIVVKRLDSTYRPGERSADWRKVKIRLRQEFVVGGWLAGQGALESEMGSLVVGVWDEGRFVAAGSVGSGLTDDERRALAATFSERTDPPFEVVPDLVRKATWVEPTTVVEIEFGDWPSDGLFRHPTYIGRRTDRDPDDVVREIPAPGQAR